MFKQDSGLNETSGYDIVPFSKSNGDWCISMKIKATLFSTILAGFFLLSPPLFAHHGYAAYDMTTVQTLKGTVTSFMLQNPHSTVSVDVTDASWRCRTLVHRMGNGSLYEGGRNQFRLAEARRRGDD